MDIKFWGTRGSCASPGAHTAHFGGNTSCVEVRAANELIILDAGTGIRPLGMELLKQAQGEPIRPHLFIGHTHWDHIQGFPFFAPAYVPGTELHVYGPRGDNRSIRQKFEVQMQWDFFPVGLRDMRAELEFTDVTGQPIELVGVSVTSYRLNHPGMEYAYRIEADGHSLVYASDVEPYEDVFPGSAGGRSPEHGLDSGLVKFIQGADVLICDGQYTMEEYQSKIGWGHSPVDYAADLAARAGVNQLFVFHHDPLHADDQVEQMVADCASKLRDAGSSAECIGAYEGLSLQVGQPVKV